MFNGALELVRILLLVQIIVGHVVAMTMPQLGGLAGLGSSSLSGSQIVARLLFGFGRESAYIFIFLSGFFTLRVVFDNQDNSRILSECLVKRLWRLVPLGVLAVTFTLLVDFSGMHLLAATVYVKNQLQYSVQDHSSFTIFILNTFQLQPTFSRTFGSNGPLWTLGYLIQFYIALILTLVVRNRVGIVFAVAGVCAFVFFLGWEFCALALVWLAGGAAAVKSSYTLWVTASRHTVSVILITVVTSLVCIGIARLSNQAGSIIFSAVASFLLVFALSGVPAWSPKLNHELSRYLHLPTKYSFAAYVVHMPLVFLSVGLVSSLGYRMESGFWFGFLVFLITAVLTLISSWFMVFLVDNGRPAIEKVSAKYSTRSSSKS